MADEQAVRGLGPRALRILFYLTTHPEFERPDLAAIRFDFLPGNDHTRVTYQEIGRKRCEDAA